MSLPARFPFVTAVAGRAAAVAMPLLPLELALRGATPLRTQGLLDTGATVNVLPFGLGLRLGAVWENQKTPVTLTGNLAAHEARAVLLEAKVADFAPVKLVFAWTRAEHVPLLLGQVNFFQERLFQNWSCEGKCGVTLRGKNASIFTRVAFHPFFSGGSHAPPLTALARRLVSAAPDRRRALRPST